MEAADKTDRKLIFAADLGGTHLRAATVDRKGHIHSRFKQNTPQVKDARAIVDAIVGAVHEFQKAAEISAVSLVVPGTVKVEEGVVVKAPNLPCLDGFRLTAALTERLGLPAILENDANAAAVGEMWQGAAVGCKTIICLTLGTGVGGGIILDGELWRGAHGSAGEIGHTTVDPFSELHCKCGNIGCLELFASATAIVRMAREGLPRFPQSMLNREDLTAERVYDAGRDGDELALSVFKRFGTYLGVGLANLINIIDPEIIVIAGGAVNGWDLFACDMKREVNERAVRVTAQQVKIAAAQCGDNAGLLGAARLAFARLCNE